MSTQPDQYRLANAFSTIDGYYLPRALVSEQERFKAAKAEAVEKLKASLADVEALTFEQFTYRKGWRKMAGGSR